MKSILVFVMLVIVVLALDHFGVSEFDTTAELANFIYGAFAALLMREIVK